MGEWKIYHNSRCSKSRECLEMLYSKNISATVIDYLRTPPTLTTLQDLAKKLGLRPHEFLRKKESIFPGLKIDVNDDNAVLAAMVEHPILIERPIIVFKDKAVVGRPPEKLAEFFQQNL